jgi:hypothetical protein
MRYRIFRGSQMFHFSIPAIAELKAASISSMENSIGQAE